MAENQTKFGFFEAENDGLCNGAIYQTASEGKLAMMIPEKPRSTLQKYKTAKNKNELPLYGV